jgi:hypothetical protein
MDPFGEKLLMNTRWLIRPLVLLSLMGGSWSQALGQDDVTVVSGITVTAVPEAPIPDVGGGAANLSVEQTASIVCEAERTGKPSLAVAKRAHDATVAAREARRRAARGESFERELVNLERERQRAIIDLTSTLRPGALPPSRGPLRIENLTYEVQIDNEQRYLIASGAIRNSSRSEVEVPTVNLHMLDLRGFLVSSQSVLLDVEMLAGGETAAFQVRLRNPALYTDQVRITVGPPLIRRTHRDCQYFEPAVFDPRRPSDQLIAPTSGTARLAPVPAVGAGAPYYTATELAEIEALLRMSIREDAINLGSSAAARSAELAGGCKLGDIGMDWRSLMRRADLAGEAWFATRTAEEARREDADPALAVAAELRRQAAVHAFMDSAPQARSRTDGLLVSAAFVAERNGRLRIDVNYENNGQAPTFAGPVMLGLIDRFGYIQRADVLVGPVGPLSSGAPITIEAGWRTAPAPAFLLEPRPGFERIALFAPCGGSRTAV